MQGKVMTVLGAIEPQDLGITLTHEHLLVDLRVWSQEPRDEEKKALIHAPVDLSTLGAIRRDPLLNLDNCVLDDVALAVAELRQFKAAGGNSVVDCTNNGLSRAPLALKEISQATGVHIIMGSGYYIGRSHPQDLHARYVEYDFFGMEFYVDTVGQYMGSDYHSISAIKRLIDEGCLERLLLSHDTGMKIQLTRYGGWGYAHLLKHVVPLLQRRGFGESEITTLLVENPQRVLTWDMPVEKETFPALKS